MKGTKRVITSLIAAILLVALGGMAVLPIGVRGQFIAEAAGKGKTAKAKKNAKDAAALNKIIKAQVKSGASISRDLNNSSYIWGNKGRLEGINWSGSYGLSGSISLKAFSGLKSFNCFGNKLTQLNLNECVNLQKLYCEINEIKKLDLRGNKNLLLLECSCNQLKELNLSRNNKLTSLTCDQNLFIRLDVSKNQKLELIECNQGVTISGAPKVCVIHEM